MSNFVELTGYLNGQPEVVVLSDGVEVVQWRLKVAREESGNDSIPCVSRDPRVKKLVLKLKEDKEIEVQGSVRSRFWRSGGATQSRIEIDVAQANKVS